jgi:hypothetical protein
MSVILLKYIGGVIDLAQIEQAPTRYFNRGGACAARRGNGYSLC